MNHLMIFVLFLGVMVAADILTRVIWMIVDKKKLGWHCNANRATTEKQ